MEAMTRSRAGACPRGIGCGAALDVARDPAAVRALIERAIDRHAPDLLPLRAQIEADPLPVAPGPGACGRSAGGGNITPPRACLSCAWRCG